MFCWNQYFDEVNVFSSSAIRFVCLFPDLLRCSKLPITSLWLCYCYSFHPESAQKRLVQIFLNDNVLRPEKSPDLGTLFYVHQIPGPRRTDEGHQQWFSRFLHPMLVSIKKISAQRTDKIHKLPVYRPRLLNTGKDDKVCLIP